ncbi:MAG: hypothetical protein P8Y44_09415 [Acidobacteriota bacterium]
MSDQETPEGSAAPSEPATEPKPTAPENATESASGNRALMIVLSYLWILFLIPMLVEKNDSEVQWHAKHGLVLTVAEILLQVLFNAIVATGVGCIFAIFIPFIFVGFAVLRLICIVKGINGERFMLPGISQYADKF